MEHLDLTKVFNALQLLLHQDKPLRTPHKFYQSNYEKAHLHFNIKPDATLASPTRQKSNEDVHEMLVSEIELM